MDDFLALLDEAPDTFTPTVIENISTPTFDVSIFDRFQYETDNLESLVCLGFGEITTQKDNQDAVQVSHEIKTLIKAIEEERKRAKEPYHKVVKLIDSNVKELRDRLDSIQSDLNLKIKNYLEAQQKIVIERMAITVSNGNNGNSVMPEIMPAVTVTDSGATAKLDTKMEWTITDFKALPDDLFIERKEQIIKAIAPYINAKMKAGITEIAGITFTQTTILKTK
jgi:hypothetical protein